MAERARKRRGGFRLQPDKTGKSLNLMLWLCFSAFAVLIVIVFALLQYLFMQLRLKAHLEQTLSRAGREIVNRFSSADNLTGVFNVLHEIEGIYGVTVFMYAADGVCVYPDFGEPGDPSLFGEVEDQLSGDWQEKVFSRDKGLCYAVEVKIGAETFYLYLTSAQGFTAMYGGNTVLITIVTGLFSIVLAFVVSGYVSEIITKPVAEVTEQAKELARGKYDLNLKGDYFCLEMRELSEALDYARTEISRADVMQKELIANVSHDFKTPLTMIKAYASMIIEISGENKQRRNAHAQVIIDECDRLTALVADLLDLSRLRAGISSDMVTVFNLSEVVYGIARRFDYLKQDGYEITTQVEDDIYAFVCRERIEQVFYNLIGNAVNYTGDDKRVTVKLFRKDGGARFEVVDTGKGIPPEEIPTIWDRYYRSKDSHKRPVSGTGLGLSIVKGILEMQGCPFGVESEQGKGSCFWVEFNAPPEEIETNQN